MFYIDASEETKETIITKLVLQEVNMPIVQHFFLFIYRNWKIRVKKYQGWNGEFEGKYFSAKQDLKDVDYAWNRSCLEQKVWIDF